MLGLGLELEPGLEQGSDLELALVSVEAGTGCLASKVGRAGLKLESELGLGQRSVQEQVIWPVPGVEPKLVQGQTPQSVVSQASRVCSAGQASTVQAGWAVLAMQGTQYQTAAGWATGC